MDPLFLPGSPLVILVIKENCKASNLPCRTTRTTSGRRPHGQSSNRHEKTIAHLQSKVEELSRSLQPVPGNTNGIGPTGRERVSPAVVRSDNASAPRQNSPTHRDDSFEGDSSFMTHSKNATQALKDSLASTPQLDVDDALSDAVTNLQKALNSSTTYSLSATYPTQSTYDDESHGLSALPLPPSDLVLKILKRAKGIS
ncbi:MAG: hypothetical protein Q9171_006467 [Xanthocarpia ochracea]